MTYEVLDTEAGDVLAIYSSFDEASSAIRDYVGSHPELVDDMAIAAVNGNGVPDKVYDARTLIEG